MTNLSLVNVIANCTTAFSALGLLIHIFGDPDNSVWDNKVKAWLAKLGLTVTTCGAISNVLTLSTPPITEVVLNCGISITFFWLNWWQWEMFKEMQANHARVKASRKQPKKTINKKPIKKKINYV
jgi:hypothetical protein